MSAVSVARRWRAPRVLFVTGEYPPLPGGVGDYTACLRAALEQLGVSVSVLTLNGAQGECVHTVRRWGWRTHYQRYIVEDGANLVHIQYQAGAFAMHPSINMLPLALQGRLKIPTITTFHDLRPPFLFPKAGGLRHRLIRSMLTRSAASIVTNPDDERAVRALGVQPTCIPIGPNLPAPSQCHPRSSIPTVAFFGYPARSKGVAELILALGQIDAARRPVLTFVGGAGRPSRHNDQFSDAQIDAQAAQLGVEIRRTGFLPPQAASNALAHETVLALPFRDGASQRSGSLLAALQTGRPVVSTAPPDITALGALARLPQLTLAPARDTPALASALESSLVTPTAAAALPEEYSWQSIAERHAELYLTILNAVRGAP